MCTSIVTLSLINSVQRLCENVTRSQAVARIADRTAKKCGVTLPRSRHFQGKLFVRLLGIADTKPCIKFEVSSSSSF